MPGLICSDGDDEKDLERCRFDEDDAAVALLRHPARGLLSQEVRALEVGGDEFVEALFGGIQKVTAFARRHAGVIHQKVETSQPLAGKPQKPFAIFAGSFAVFTTASYFGTSELSSPGNETKNYIRRPPATARITCPGSTRNCASYDPETTNGSSTSDAITATSNGSRT